MDPLLRLPGDVMFNKSSLSATAEFRRIAALPRRTERDWAALALELTAVLKTPGGTWTLKPIQAQALIELAETGGLFGPIPVGYGKTLISLLAPYVLDSVRPILILPAALVEKTRYEKEKLREHWRIPGNIRIISYEELGRVKAERLLQGQTPDLIVCDESHKIKSPKAAVTRRVVRYMKEHPDTKFAALSGTMMIRSLKDFGHILKFTHKSGAPVPSSDQELSEWADCLDEKVNPLKRVRPGPLVDWSPPGKHDSALQAARRGFHARLVATPGVVAAGADAEGVGASLYLQALVYQTSATTEANFETLRTLNETPDGWTFSESALEWMYARQLALGFNGVWSPRPPEVWRDARREWASYVREILSRSQSIDSELAVTNAVDDGKLPSGREPLAKWRAIRPTFKINPKDIWHDESALATCEAWIKQGPGIVWVSHVFFGRELSRRTGVPYFGQEATDAQGRHLQAFADHVVDKPVPIIASAFACVEGLNLQKTWDRNLISAPDPSAKQWEQLLGRTHRPGHRSDEVSVDVMIGCIEHWEALHKAMAQAKATGDMMGSTQRLTLADKILPKEVDILSQAGYRWNRA